jgi:hypothetical protein
VQVEHALGTDAAKPAHLYALDVRAMQRRAHLVGDDVWRRWPDPVVDVGGEHLIAVTSGDHVIRKGLTLEPLLDDALQEDVCHECLGRRMPSP